MYIHVGVSDCCVVIHELYSSNITTNKNVDT